MSSRCDFLLQYFGDRHILLKEDWLNSVIDFIHDQLPQSKNFSDENFANLVLDQWTCSNIEETSFPTFGNHAIDASIRKQHLQGPIVCQVNGFIDVGSPYYQQFNNLSGGKNKEDNSGFEKVFHEKEDDTDQKPSRLLKLTLTDGESNLTAIEFWKCRQLSLHCKPGTKILIEPPCDIRTGTFLLKPNNCKILGGEVLPLLNRYLPLERYARMLEIEDFEATSISNTPVAERRSTTTIVRNDVPSTSTSFSSSATIPRPAVCSAPGPPAPIRRYFTKKPAPPSRAPDPREIFPDIMAETEIVDDFENDDFDYQSQPSTSNKSGWTPNENPSVSSFLSRIIQDDEMEEFETLRRIKSPNKKSSSIQTPDPTRRISGLLTSRRVDPMDEILENMIEKGEEPVSLPERKSTNPFKIQSEPPMKRVKIEEESDDDDDIHIIKLVTPSIKQKKPEEKDELTSEERSAVNAYSALKLSSLTESLKRMKFSIGSKRSSILAIIEDIADPLRVVDELWTMKVQLRDETGDAEALIDNQTLQNLIGYPSKEAMAIRRSNDMEKRRDGKRRLEALEQQLQRLDLVFQIEFFPGSNPPCPVIRSMKTLAELINVY